MAKHLTANFVRLKNVRMTKGTRMDENGVEQDEITLSIKGIITYSPDEGGESTEIVEKIEISMISEDFKTKKLFLAFEEYAVSQLKNRVELD